MVTALDTLLGPVTPEEIMAPLEAGEVRYFPCGGGERLLGLMNWRKFAEQLAVYEPDAKTLEVTKDGKPVPHEWLAGGSGAKALSGPQFARLARQGISVALRQLECRSPVLRALWHEARRALGCPIHITAIATFGAGRAFEPHYDGTDLAVVQLAGSKGWEIIGERVEAAAPHGRNVDAGRDTPFSPSFLLRPGDVLVVPYGQAHRCWSEGSSLHLGFAIKRHTGADYMRWFSEKVRDLPDLRLPVPFPTDPGAGQYFDEEVRLRLGGLMKRFGPEAFLAERNRLEGADPISLADLPDDARDHS